MLKKFNEIEYKRLDYEATAVEIKTLIEKLKNASKYDDFFKTLKDIIAIQNTIEEMYDYVDINNMRALTNEYYLNEMEYWAAFKPKYDLLFLPFYEIIHKSEYKEQLETIIPINFFKSIEAKIKTTNSDIVELRKREKDLIRQYNDLNKKTVLFEGEEKTLAYVSGFFSSSNRDLRKKAHDIINDFYLEHENKYLNILYELVKIRTQIAKRCGFKNYCEYSLYHLRRFNYDYQDIKKFRDNICKYIKPIIDELNQKKKNELGIDDLKYYDTIFFKDMPEIKYKDNELCRRFIYFIR